VGCRHLDLALHLASVIPEWSGSEAAVTSRAEARREWKTEVPRRGCRKYAVNAAQMYRRKPRRSPESNGLAESFFGSFKWDYVYQACPETLEEVGRQIPKWIEHYNHQAPHSALAMQSPAEFYAEWMVNNKRLSVQN
jgi:transposase InsO family protein